MQELKRVPFVVERGEVARLAESVAAELGYGTLRDTLRVPGPLGQALHDIDISPFSSPEVAEYKNDLRDKISEEQSALRMEGQRKYEKNEYSVFWGLARLLRLSKREPVNPNEAPFYSMYPDRVEVKWRTVSLAEYKAPIPEFVLRKALAIKAACPGVAFHIEELRIDHIPADPFLVVSLDHERYYVEVWDEPKFEAAI